MEGKWNRKKTASILAAIMVLSMFAMIVMSVESKSADMPNLTVIQTPRHVFTDATEVFSPGTNPWDNQGVFALSLIRDSNETYRMYYNTWGDADETRHVQIGYAKSEDGKIWTDRQRVIVHTTGMLDPEGLYYSKAYLPSLITNPDGTEYRTPEGNLVIYHGQYYDTDVTWWWNHYFVRQESPTWTGPWDEIARFTWETGSDETWLYPQNVLRTTNGEYWAYYLWTSDHLGENTFKLYCRKSTDGGMTFGPETLVTGIKDWDAPPEGHIPGAWCAYSIKVIETDTGYSLYGQRYNYSTKEWEYFTSTSTDGLSWTTEETYTIYDVDGNDVTGPIIAVFPDGYVYFNHNNSVWIASTKEVQPTVSISTDKFKYLPVDTMTMNITIDIANPTEDEVTFQWYWAVPQFGIWRPVMSAPIPAGYSDTLNFSYILPLFGPTPFGNVFYVQLLDADGEVLDADAACWAFSPPGGKVMPVDIAEEIKKTIEKVELPS